MKYLIILIALFSFNLFGQTDYRDCQKLLELSNKITGHEEGNYNGSMPKFIGSEDSLKILLSKPPYPKEAIKYLIEDTVKVSCVIDTVGIPHCFVVSKGIGYGSDEAALKYLKDLKLRFYPAIYRYKGHYRPIAVKISFPVVFKLSDPK